MSVAYKCIISSHLNPHLSGVAKFNRRLSEMLKVPCIGREDIYKLWKGPALLSIKLGDNSHSELANIEEIFKHLTNKGIIYDLFFHTFSGLDIEFKLLERCRRVYSANNEIKHALEGIGKTVISAWCPPLVKDSVILHESKLNIFSFGMAHKIQVKYYKMLKELLDKHHIDYSLWVSTAFHEKANFGEFDAISEQLGSVFKHRIYFLGFISDEAVNYFLEKSNLFVAFFTKGVRANNTSVYAAMRRGCAVLTNYDAHSPKWMQHNKNILDIHKVSLRDIHMSNIKKIGLKSKNDVKKFASWRDLLKILR